MQIAGSVSTVVPVSEPETERPIPAGPVDAVLFAGEREHLREHLQLRVANQVEQPVLGKTFWSHSEVVENGPRRISVLYEGVDA
jgi:hypothetical protein